MKTYMEAVQFAVDNAAGHAYNSYMSGSNEYFRYMALSQQEVDMIAFVYSRSVETIARITTQLIEARFDQLLAHQHQAVRALEGQL